ncbi:hypothetical protein [uncultured Aquimarina sp.]|uniref:hypothetical protein n=1 Tax=uncultured Aquimarina sp. TaxID=575652 RepID=UPI002639C9FE|nr:hypothetical protein [uncultured Aquimarina sp.]
MNKKDKLLIKWIKNEQLEGPNTHFTSDFLEMIQENETFLKTKDVRINEVLFHNTLDPIRSDFTKKVVSLIEKNNEDEVIEPLISKKVLIIFISSILMLSLFFEIYTNSEQIEINSVFLDIINSALKFIQKTPILLIYIMSSSVLILTIEKIFLTIGNILSEN